ncbi:hypothetical protein Y032_0490g2389 [Ancylostoma ceylanicum]|nr:hypothetical protein Y032_0490g2389 [Ancylostoma ceylanicum]
MGGGGSGGCQCATCPQPVTCAPAPTCAIPLPCPSATDYALPAAPVESQYQGSYQQVLPVVQPVSAPVPIAAPQQPIPYQPAPSPFQPPTYQSLPPTYESVRPVYHTVLPSPTATYVAPQPHFTNPVQPIQPVQTVPNVEQYDESLPETSHYPTLMPTPASTPSPYTSETQDHTSIIAFDDSSPALPPPAPSEAPSSQASSVEYKTTGNEITDISVQDNEAQLVTAATTVAPLFYDDHDNSIERMGAYQQSVHSGSTSGPWAEIPFQRRISTEGYSPLGMYQKRYMILKRMRNARQLAATVPRTNTTCNSHKLANVMVRVMVDDVSVSKRTVLRATEMAFDGDKYDVFCAKGEFSYSIHSRKYCEVTKDDVTCFAFR